MDELRKIMTVNITGSNIVSVNIYRQANFGDSVRVNEYYNNPKMAPSSISINGLDIVDAILSALDAVGINNIAA